MPIYSDYLHQNLTSEQLHIERTNQLVRISKLRGRDVIVYASNLSPLHACPNGIDISDIVPLKDQLSVLTGEEVDIILQTPGGSAEVVEDLVKLIRDKFTKIGIIIPGSAYSAGTIFALAGDEILMSSTSSFGPIDAQIISNGKRFSADAFLEGLEKIREETNKNGRLDLIYVPLLANISPGEIQHCRNAQQFSKTLVTTWLKQYKFKFWTHHSSTNEPVTELEKEQRAIEIAAALSNQSKWLTHGRSIKIKDLLELRLKITDFSQDLELNDAITRYHALLQIIFDTNIFKIIETKTSHIFKSFNIAQRR